MALVTKSVNYLSTSSKYESQEMGNFLDEVMDENLWAHKSYATLSLPLPPVHMEPIFGLQDTTPMSRNTSLHYAIHPC